MVKIKHKGQEVEATPIEVLSQEEFFNTYQLVDGSVLKVKSVVTDILKVDGKTTPGGGPVYIIQSETVVHLRET